MKIEIDRPTAQRITRSGKIDHNGKYSYFGQFMQQCLKNQGPENSYLKALAQMKKDDYDWKKCERFNDEGAAVALSPQ